eukprot:524850_1
MTRYIRKKDFNGKILKILINDIICNRMDGKRILAIWDLMTLDNAIEAVRENIVTCEDEKDTLKNLTILMLCRSSVIVCQQTFSEFDRANKYLMEIYEIMVVKKIWFVFEFQLKMHFVAILCEAALMNIYIRPHVFKKILALKFWIAANDRCYYKENKNWLCFRYICTKRNTPILTTKEWVNISRKHLKWFQISSQHLTKCFQFMVKDAGDSDVEKCMKKILVYQAYCLALQQYTPEQCKSKLIELIENIKEKQIKKRLFIALRKVLLNKNMIKFDLECDKQYDAFGDIGIILKSKKNRLWIKNMINDKKCSLCYSKCSKLRMCRKCKKQWYCCRNHQKKDWNKCHRYNCC